MQEQKPSHKRHVPIKLIMARSGQGWRRLKISLALLSVKIRSRDPSRHTFGVVKSRTSIIGTNRSLMSIHSMAPACEESGPRQKLSVSASFSLCSFFFLFISSLFFSSFFTHVLHLLHSSPPFSSLISSLLFPSPSFF